MQNYVSYEHFFNNFRIAVESFIIVYYNKFYVKLNLDKTKKRREKKILLNKSRFLNKMPRRSSGSSATSSLIKSSLGFTRSTRSASYNESSNEVPPSNQSVSTNSSTSTTNPTTSSNSNENANTVLDIEENSSTSRERNSIESEEDPDADSANLLERIKKRTISGVLKSEADIEFQCPICYDLIEAANMTKCGHSFCRSCIQEALERSRRCPKCNTPCSINKDVFPNFTCMAHKISKFWVCFYVLITESFHLK